HEEVRLRAARLVARPGPVRDGEHVMAPPFEALLADGRAPLAGGYEADGVIRPSRGPRSRLDPFQVQIESRHHGAAVLRIAHRPGPVGADFRFGEPTAHLVAWEAVLGGAFGADFPEAFVVPRAGLEKARVERADRRHVGGIEPDRASLAAVDVPVPAHRRREDEIAVLHLAAP